MFNYLNITDVSLNWHIDSSFIVFVTLHFTDQNFLYFLSEEIPYFSLASVRFSCHLRELLAGILGRGFPEIHCSCPFLQVDFLRKEASDAPRSMSCLQSRVWVSLYTGRENGAQQNHVSARQSQYMVAFCKPENGPASEIREKGVCLQMWRGILEIWVGVGGGYMKKRVGY